MKKTALVIMAAGIGSRFGKGIKQLEPVGPGGEIIMDYSIHDALEAGFDKIVFIIRRDLEADFKEIIGRRIERIAEVNYAFQELTDLPDGFHKPAGRTKPWGTGQAVLSCKDLLTDPFVVINADDYYGKEPFVKIHQYLTEEMPMKQGDCFDFCMAGFRLGNTLSENGGVTRGICRLDAQQRLVGISETKNICKTPEGAVIRRADGSEPVSVDSKVSMNMWGLQPEFLEELERGFVKFLETLPEEAGTQEYLLPTIIDGLLQEGRARVRVIDTTAQWFGVTYQEDKAAVIAAIRDLIDRGVYREKLYEK